MAQSFVVVRQLVQLLYVLPLVGLATRWR